MDSQKSLIVIHSVSSWLPQTGTWLYHQVRFLPTDIESHVVCESTQNLDQFPIQNLHSLDELPRWKPIWDKGVRKLGFRRHLHYLVEMGESTGAQLLHSHFGNIGWQDMGAARQIGMKHVVTFYGLDVNYMPTADPRWHGRYRSLFKQADRILCEGAHMARSIVELGCPEEKVHVHHLGVNVDDLPFVPRKWKPGSPLRALIAASFREKKGIPYAIEALGRLQHEVPVEITIIGDAFGELRTIEEKAKILAAIDKHRLGPKARLLGYRPYSVVLEEAYRHHVFLAPSITASDGDTEGGAPVSIIEMCAAGMPVVSTKHCDIPGVILDGQTGLLAEERDVDGLLSHLRWLVEHPESWEEMLTLARRRIEHEFNAKVQCERLAAMYRELVGV